MNQNPHDRFYWINALRAMATVAVIFLHVSGDSLYLFTPDPDSAWWIGNCYDSFVRFCVPVFVMITGALLLPLREDWLSFYKRRLLRIFFPFMAWTVLYLLLNYQSALRHHTSVDLTWLLGQIKNGGAYHLWYIYMIISMYAVIPVISRVIQKAKELYILLFLAVWTVSLAFHPYPEYWFFGYTGYLILGYYLKIKVFANTRKINIRAGLLFFTGVLITIFGTYFSSEKTGKFDEHFYSFLSINVMMASTGVFLFFRDFNVPRQAKSVELINKHSYGIYLSHVMILFFLSKAGFTYNSINSAVGIPLLSAITLLISLGLTMLINKLPLGKYISG